MLWEVLACVRGAFLRLGRRVEWACLSEEVLVRWERASFLSYRNARVSELHQHRYIILEMNCIGYQNKHC